MAAALRFARFAPQRDLAGLLDHVWLLSGDGDGQAQAVWPDGSPEWVFQLADPFEQQQADGAWRRQPRRLLVGQQTRRVMLRPGRRVRCLGLHLQPPALAALMAGDPRRHTDRIEALDAALGERLAPLARRLAALDDGAAVAALQAWLAARPRTAVDERLVRSVQALRSVGTALPALARELGWSERQLRRRFEAAVGLAPKRFARLCRFQQVSAAGRLQDAGAWAAAALDGGYCDQAHFSRDFRAFTGHAPRQLLRELQPLTDFFLGMSENSKTTA